MQLINSHENNNNLKLKTVTQQLFISLCMFKIHIIVNIICEIQGGTIKLSP